MVLLRSRILVVLTAALVAAFFIAPPALAGGDYTDERHLTAALRGAFVDYWASGRRPLTPALSHVVDYWLRYHLAKGAIAALLLAVLVTLGVRLWRSGRTVVLAPLTLLALLSLATVMANIQGAVAPFASLLPMLVDGGPDAALAGTLTDIRAHLAAGPTPPPLAAIIGDYTLYHVAMAAIAGVLALALAAAAVLLWRAFARTRSRTAASYGVLTALLALSAAVVAVANTTTAADPLPGLAGLFAGGW